MFQWIARVATVLLFCTCTPFLRAADLGDYPAQTLWILSCDIRAAHTSPLVRQVLDTLDTKKRKEAESKLAIFETLFGMNLVRDIDRVVIAGNGNAEKGGVAYVYGRLDAQRFTTVLSGAKQYTSADHNGVEIQSWLDDSDNKKKYAAFVNPGLTLFSDTQKSLADALDVIAKRQPGLPPGSPLKGAVTASAGEILALHAFQIAAIAGTQPQAEALKQAEALSARIAAPDAETLSAFFSVTATSEQTAVQIQQALTGIQAIAMLRAADDPDTAAIASQASITCQGRTVDVSVTLTANQVGTVLRARKNRTAAALAAPSTAPPQ